MAPVLECWRAARASFPPGEGASDTANDVATSACLVICRVVDPAFTS
jgi:hypothetical protein